MASFREKARKIGARQLQFASTRKWRAAIAVPTYPPEKKERIAGHLRAVRQGEKLLYGTVNTFAYEYDHPKAVERVWSIVKKVRSTNFPAFTSKRNQCGKPKKWKEVQASIPEVPFHKRIKLRSTAKALKVGKTTVHRTLKNSDIKRVTSAVKPHLNDVYKSKRLEFCLSQVEPDDGYRINAFENRVFIDEKWFELTRVKQG